MHTDATVFVVDDDQSVRKSLTELAKSVNLNVKTFIHAQEFLESYDPATPGCLVLDVRMPGMSGLELQEVLKKRGVHIPIIFITGHGDMPIAVRAMKDGAMDFIEKPFQPQQLLDLINRAIARDAGARQVQARTARIKAHMALLTAREREVLDLVVAGKFNKEIAVELGISQRTVEIHRNQVMKKMQADSVVDLVRMILAVRNQDTA